MKRYTTGWEKTFPKYISDKGLVSRKCLEYKNNFQNSTLKKSN